jgi:hypothetical protein
VGPVIFRNIDLQVVGLPLGMLKILDVKMYFIL